MKMIQSVMVLGLFAGLNLSFALEAKVQRASSLHQTTPSKAMVHASKPQSGSGPSKSSGKSDGAAALDAMSKKQVNEFNKQYPSKPSTAKTTTSGAPEKLNSGTVNSKASKSNSSQDPFAHLGSSENAPLPKLGEEPNSSVLGTSPTAQKIDLNAARQNLRGGVQGANPAPIQAKQSATGTSPNSQTVDFNAARQNLRKTGTQGTNATPTANQSVTGTSPYSQTVDFNAVRQGLRSTQPATNQSN